MLMKESGILQILNETSASPSEIGLGESFPMQIISSLPVQPWRNLRRWLEWRWFLSGRKFWFFAFDGGLYEIQPADVVAEKLSSVSWRFPFGERYWMNSMLIRNWLSIEEKCGRMLFAGVPTGVRSGLRHAAMEAPFPSTTTLPRAHQWDSCHQAFLLDRCPFRICQRNSSWWIEKTEIHLEFMRQVNGKFEVVYEFRFCIHEILGNQSLFNKNLKFRD